MLSAEQRTHRAGPPASQSIRRLASRRRPASRTRRATTPRSCLQWQKPGGGRASRAWHGLAWPNAVLPIWRSRRARRDATRTRVLGTTDSPPRRGANRARSAKRSACPLRLRHSPLSSPRLAALAALAVATGGMDTRRAQPATPASSAGTLPATGCATRCLVIYRAPRPMSARHRGRPTNQRPGLPCRRASREPSEALWRTAVRAAAPRFAGGASDKQNAEHAELGAR